ncbi:DNA-processing protein DprA [Nannocystaceae bacterium ST9]
MSDWLKRPSILLDPSEHDLLGSEHLELIGSLPPRPRLAVVGSRAAHARYLRALEPVIAAAQAEGWSLISGGALGIDAGAHRLALRLACPQVAVLPCGRDRVYPPGHAELFEQIHRRPDSGLIFAQPAGTEPCRAMFASRNRIVVGLADAVLVAEASLRSGSFGTGRLARKAGLRLAVFAGTAGCGMLIAEGAHALPEPGVGNEEPAAARARVRDWLRGETAAATSSWPDELIWLREILVAGPSAGVVIEAFEDPTRAIVGLCEAELLGLVCEVTSGRWRAVVG